MKSLSHHICPNRFISFFVVSFFGLSGFSQNKRVISGIIRSSDDRLPVVGVTISAKHENVSTASNEEGRFELVENSRLIIDTLTFSCVGYQSQDYVVNDANKPVNIYLQKSIDELREIVVRPLSITELIDSIKVHNQKAFLIPVTYNGYYKELVYTNDKCTEYSDALFEYLASEHSDNGDLRIIASRCLKEKQVNEDKNDLQIYTPSKVNPTQLFKYSFFSGLLDMYFPKQSLKLYKYQLEEEPNHLKFTISPKEVTEESYYRLIINLNDNYDLVSFHLEVPEPDTRFFKEKSILSLHLRYTKLTIDATYNKTLKGIYPNFFSMVKAYNFWGKFLGTTTNLHVINKSQFIISSFKDGVMGNTPKSAIFKKGNLCSNGIAINDALLKDHTIIRPTAKDSISISTLQPQ